MIFIIGSGINGLSIANKLLSKGFEVTIFEFEKKGKSSKAAVGMLAPLIESKPYENRLFKLMLESKKLWNKFSKQISEVSNIDIEFKKNSSLMIANDYGELEKLKFKKKFFEKQGFQTKLLNKKQTLDKEPYLSENVESSLLCNNQDQVNTQLLLKSLEKSFIKKGGIFEKKSKVSKIFNDNKSVGIIIDEKKKIASQIVLAAGVWSYEIIKESFNLSIPLKPVKGVNLSIKSPKSESLIKHNLWFNNIYVAPRNNGEILIGATEEEKGFETIINSKEVYYLTKNLWENLPFTEDFEILGFSSGLRPVTFDGMPVIGNFDYVSKDIIFAFGHYRHGVLLAPITAEIIYECIKKKKTSENFSAFSPNRYIFNKENS